MISGLQIIFCLLFIATTPCFSARCTTCTNEECSKKEALAVSNKNTPKLPFQENSSKNKESLQYGCLRLKYIKDSEVHILQQCILAENINYFCGNIPENIHVIYCSVNSPIKKRKERDIQDIDEQNGNLEINLTTAEDVTVTEPATESDASYTTTVSPTQTETTTGQIAISTISDNNKINTESLIVQPTESATATQLTSQNDVTFSTIFISTETTTAFDPATLLSINDDKINKESLSTTQSTSTVTATDFTTETDTHTQSTTGAMTPSTVATTPTTIITTTTAIITTSGLSTSIAPKTTLTISEPSATTRNVGKEETSTTPSVPDETTIFFSSTAISSETLTDKKELSTITLSSASSELNSSIPPSTLSTKVTEGDSNTQSEIFQSTVEYTTGDPTQTVNAESSVFYEDFSTTDSSSLKEISEKPHERPEYSNQPNNSASTFFEFSLILFILPIVYYSML